MDCLAHRPTNSALNFEAILLDRYTVIVCRWHLSLCQNTRCIVPCFDLSSVWYSLIRSKSSLFRLLLLNLLIWSLWLLLVWKNHLAWVRGNMIVSIAWFCPNMSSKDLLNYLSQKQISSPPISISPEFRYVFQMISPFLFLIQSCVYR